MTDKEKIRAEIERRYNERDRLGDNIRANVHKSLISFIDTMQEEPSLSNKQSVDEAMAEIERKAKLFTEANKGKTSEEILAEMRGEEPVSNPTPNEKMSVERWKKACEAACCDTNYRSHYGLTETRDDYFVDGVQWADEHPKEEPVSVWHDASEEPEEGKDFAFVTYNGIMWARYRIEDIFLGWQKYRIQTELDKWAYVSDLLKL